MSNALDFSKFLDQNAIRPFGTLLCADEAFTMGEVLKVQDALKADWAAQLERDGIHTVADAIEVYWNPPGQMDEGDHVKHGHIALKTFGVKQHG